MQTVPSQATAVLLGAVVVMAIITAWLPTELSAGLLALAGLVVMALRWPYAPLLLLAPLATWGPALPGIPLVGSQAGVNEILIGFTVVAWFLDGLRRRQLSPPPLAALFVVGLLLWSKTLSLSLGYSLTAGLTEWVKWMETGLVLLLTPALLPRRALGWLVAGLLLGALAQSALGLWQFINAHGPPAFLILDGRFARATGALRQPNPFAGFMGVSYPVALSLLLWWITRYRSTRQGRWLAVAVLLLAATTLLGLGLLASWSRGAWLGAAAASVMVLLLSGRQVFLWITTGSAVALLIATVARLAPLPGTIIERLADLPSYFAWIDPQRTPVTDANFAVLQRVAHWEAAAKMFADHPWTGVGIGSYPVVYSAYAAPRWQDPLGHAHNYYLHVAAEMGIIGLLAYAIGALSLLAAIAAAWKANGTARLMAVSVTGALTHLAIHNIFDNLFVHGIYLCFGLLIGALLVSIQSVARVTHQDLSNPRLSDWTLTAGGLLEENNESCRASTFQSTCCACHPFQTNPSQRG